jgi:hypothetical protein
MPARPAVLGRIGCSLLPSPHSSRTGPRLHEGSRRRVKTQGSLPTEEAALVLGPSRGRRPPSGHVGAEQRMEGMRNSDGRGRIPGAS